MRDLERGVLFQTGSVKPKHLLTGAELSMCQIKGLLGTARILKQQRKKNILQNTLAGLSLALLFDKPSLRTRFSFTIAMRELGGDVIESVESTRKKETPEDYARVLSGYCHGLMVRTHEDIVLERMRKTAEVPIINGLSDLHHPCQILGDLLTLQEVFGNLFGLTLCYIGDGNNILHSLLLLAPQMGVNVHYCCPINRGPNASILMKSIESTSENTGKICSFSQPKLAVEKSHAVYTDVWASMGFEKTTDEKNFIGFQVNESLMQFARSNAIFMHCLPMERGKEVSESLPDQSCSVIFQQSENRLHIQKALLLFFLAGEALCHKK
jgi:ornithine carbamoyltransferase